ncbi:MAG: purple acid phosphatase family protein [Promethearchaeota archaeon]
MRAAEENDKEESQGVRSDDKRAKYSKSGAGGRKWRVAFGVVAVSAVLTLVGLSLVFQEEISDALRDLGTSEEAMYWVLGTVVFYALFGLLAGYMVFSLAKKPPNLTRWSKTWSALCLPLLLVTSVGSFVYYGLNIVPDARGPYLSWTRDPQTTMTIAWELKASGQYEVQYGVDPAKLDQSIQATRLEKRDDDGYYHYIATITGLSPGRRYYYRVPGVMDAQAAFKTAPDSATGNFTFILYGDSRETQKIGDNQHIALVEQILKRVDVSTISFVVNTGDTAYAHDHVRSWNLHFLAIRGLATRAPYFVASGNHEWNTGNPQDQVGQPANLIQEFPAEDRPSEDIGGLNETSFAFGYGCAYFIFIGYPHEGHLGYDAVNQWLNQQLAIGNSSYKFTFVSFHRPPFDRREHSYNDATDIIEHQAKMLHMGGVDAVFNGHNHVLAEEEIRWDPSGNDPTARNVTYIISGGGGATLRQPKYGSWANNYSQGFYGRTVYASSVYHFFVVEVDGTAGTATFTPYDLSGNVIQAALTLKAFK